MNWEGRYHAMVRECANECESIMRLGRAVYVWVRPATDDGQWGALLCCAPGEHPGAGWEPLTGERMPCHVPYSQLFAWLLERTRHAPIIGDYGR